MEVLLKLKEKVDNIKNGRFQLAIVASDDTEDNTDALFLLAVLNIDNKDFNFQFNRVDGKCNNIMTELLKVVDENYTDYIVKNIKKLVDEGFDFAPLAYNYNDSFASIREYTELLSNPSNSPEEIKKIFQLGTGTLKSKRLFDKYGLRPLSKYERSDLLVLFLNILAQVGKYITFCFDGIEKIKEKSLPRFYEFITSLREIIDMSNKIRGHCMIMTMKDYDAVNSIRVLSEPVYQRVYGDVFQL